MALENCVIYNWRGGENVHFQHKTHTLASFGQLTSKSAKMVNLCFSSNCWLNAFSLNCGYLKVELTCMLMHAILPEHRFTELKLVFVFIYEGACLHFTTNEIARLSGLKNNPVKFNI